MDFYLFGICGLAYLDLWILESFLMLVGLESGHQ